MAGTSKTILNKSGKSGHHCLVPDLRGNAFTFGWQLATWVSRVFPYSLTDKSGMLSLNCLYKHNSSCWIIAFLLGVWHLSMCQAEVPYVTSINKNHRSWVSKQLPWKITFCTCCHHSLLEEFSSFCVNPLGKNTWELGLVSSWLWPCKYMFLSVDSYLISDLGLTIYYLEDPLFPTAWVINCLSYFSNSEATNRER